MHLLAVFDGHRGHQAADFAAAGLSRELGACGGIASPAEALEVSLLTCICNNSIFIDYISYLFIISFYN